jgi:hypothetical protein
MSILTDALSFGNEILSSAIVLTAFSLLAYLLIHNILSPVARAFCALIAGVVVVYAGDVGLYNVQTLTGATFWLKFQWIGIAFVPAAYLHFSDALLRTTNSISRWRHRAVQISYLLSAIFLYLAVTTEIVVREGMYAPRATRLTAGPLFGLFAAYYFLTVAAGAWNIQQARNRCLTPALRRRMGYLALSFVAPGLGVFPYLLVAGMPRHLSLNVFLVLLGAGNLGVAMMITIMAYSVAFFGVFTPDRVVRHSFVHYLLRGPFVGICVIVSTLLIPKVGQILGLSRDTVLVLAVVGVVVVLQVLIDAAMPFIDRVIYRRDREEVAWIQQLDRHLLTSTDLNQLLENILVTVCELLRIKSGFAAVVVDENTFLEASCGLSSRRAEELVTADLPADIATADESSRVSLGQFDFVIKSGFWLLTLNNKAGIQVGVLGLAAPLSRPVMSDDELAAFGRLVTQAAQALEDRHLQQGVFGALATIMPQLETVQRWRGQLQYAGAPASTMAVNGDLDGPGFQRMVKDALSHYWGGPKLSDSPLLSLRTVQTALAENGGSPTRALRAVLGQAITALKPDGQRSMTGAEWLLYNILELKFIEGHRTRDVASRLAMSESDLYRKQRIAVEEVARVLAEMERNPQSPDGDEAA